MILANYSWAWGMLWTIVDMLCDSPLEHTDSISRQIPIANSYLYRRGIFSFIFIWALHFSLLPSLHLSSHSTLTQYLHTLNLLRRSCLFLLPIWLDLCMSLLGYSLLSRFSVIVIFRLVFFAICLKTTNEWVHVIIVFLCLGYLTQNDVF